MSGKIKAFTIMELTMTMLLTGIVFAMGWAGYRVVARQFDQYRTNRQAISDRAVILTLLRKDMALAAAVQREGNGFRAVYPYSPDVVYAFQPPLILRHDAAISDTFNLGIQDVSFRMDGNVLSGTDQLVDELVLTSTDPQHAGWQFRKDYGAARYMKNARSHEH
ncbi:MAG: hypothetical protein AAGB22_12760 [Bacteroidota bacterium]